MKAKILLLIILSSLIMCCRTKHKITTAYKENLKETEKVKIDSFNVQDLQTNQNMSSNALLTENKNETSGEVLIKGKADVSNPFVFHNVVGKDTVQSISIIGNAEYSINNHYIKADHTKSDTRKDEFTSIIKDLAQSTVSKEKIKEIDATISEESKKIKSTGFQAGTWIVVTIVVIFLLFIFFTYKYFKK